MNKGKRIFIEKIAKCEGGLPPADNMIQGQPTPFGYSLPIEYNVEGILIEEMKIGDGVSIHREKRNGLPIRGEFITTPLKNIGDNYFETLNSIYRYKFV